MAAVAVTFSRYFLELTNLRVPDKLIAAVALAALTVINCLGVRAGSSVQSLLMVLKILAILGLIVCGLWLIGSQDGNRTVYNRQRGRHRFGSFIWLSDHDRSRDGSGALCIWWLANFDLRRRGNTRAAKEPSARADNRCDGRGHTLPGGEFRLCLVRSEFQVWPIRRRRLPMSCDLLWARPGRGLLPRA